ncbi:hypothetical protein BH24CHL9_BH24CHL9_06940 [soil metagenome]
MTTEPLAVSGGTSARARPRVTFSVGLMLATSIAAPWPALAQDAVSASPTPTASSLPDVTPAPSASTRRDGAVVPSLLAPAWSRIQAAHSPAAREDHTWTVDEQGAGAYLFGGRDGGTAFDDLWRCDLATDTWSRLRPSGSRPSARFGHSAAWLPGTGLVVFAGQRGTDFFSDLWAYDPGLDRWTRLPARGAAPAARYGSCAVVGRDGRLVISHGFTFRGRFDDTRAYNFRTGRWASVAPAGRRPGERCLHECFTDAEGQLVLYGGQDNQNASLGDLWSTRPDAWTRAPDPSAAARRLHAVTEAGPDAWVFGGAGRDGSALDDLWRVDRATLQFERVRPAGGSPPARWAGTLVTDTTRGRLLLLGGMGRNALGDMWQLTDSAPAMPAPEDTAVGTPAQGDDSTASPAPGG